MNQYKCKKVFHKLCLNHWIGFEVTNMQNIPIMTKSAKIKIGLI